jgi:hypothetical protein
VEDQKTIAKSKPELGVVTACKTEPELVRPGSDAESVSHLSLHIVHGARLREAWGDPTGIDPSVREELHNYGPREFVDIQIPVRKCQRRHSYGR